MGFFWKKAKPRTPGEAVATEEEKTTFAWQRAVGAVIVLILLIGMAAYAGLQPALAGLYQGLVSLIQLYAGALIGGVLGEAAGQR